MSRLRVVTLLLALAPVAGCATLSFKAGAGPDRMSSDEHNCGQAGDEGFADCMRNLGYYVTDGAIGSPDTGAAASPVAAGVTPTPTPSALVPPTTVAPAPVATAASAPPAAASPVPSVPAPPAAAATPVAAPAAAPTGSTGLPSVRVASWWKLGGSAAGLDNSIATCTQKLGSPHQPAPGATVVTLAMRDCLRGDGWIAYGESSAP